MTTAKRGGRKSPQVVGSEVTIRSKGKTRAPRPPGDSLEALMASKGGAAQGTAKELSSVVEGVLGATKVELVDWLEGTVKLPPTKLSTADVIVRLAQRTNLPKRYFTEVVKVSQSTMSRHGSAKAPVPVDVADAAFQFAELVDRVEHMRGQVAAAAWLSRSNPHLGGRSPLEFMTTETGRRRVSRYLDSLEEGTYG